MAKKIRSHSNLPESAENRLFGDLLGDSSAATPDLVTAGGGLLNEEYSLIPLEQDALEALSEAPLSDAPFADASGPEASLADAPFVEGELQDVAELEVERDSAAAVSQDPDGELARAFIAGSEQAFIQLYAKYEAPLLLYCKRMLANERIAEDAFQEIWIRVFELRSRQVQVTFFKALLFRSARNLCLNMLRVEKLRAGSSDQLLEAVASEETGRSTEQKEIKRLVRHALSKLPFDQREAFVMHEYSGYSYAEIAEMMGSTETNVKVRAYRARIRLRKLIQGWLGLGEADDPANVI